MIICQNYVNILVKAAQKIQQADYSFLTKWRDTEDTQNKQKKKKYQGQNVE